MVKYCIYTWHIGAYDRWQKDKSVVILFMFNYVYVNAQKGIMDY